MNIKYSWRGIPKPSQDFHEFRPSSLLAHEIRSERVTQWVHSEEYSDLMNFRDDLPMIQYENESINKRSKLNYPEK